MPYNYDYFISYAHADNKPDDGKPGFVDEFVNKLQDSEEHQRMFGRKTEVFFDKSEIKNMSDWDNRIRSSLSTSRFLIVLLSPGYFKSEYCAREFDWWMQHEMHRRMLGEGTAPMLVVDVSQMYDYQSETIPDIPEELQARFPNWLSQIRKIQSGPQFDMRDLDRAKISEALDSLREEVKDRVQRQNNAENSPNNALYPRYNQNFVGRRENLRSLRKSLSERVAATYSALTGLGGFGKTELALTYGHAFAWDYQLGRIFVKSENKTSLTDILLSCGIAEMNGWELPKGTDQQKLAFLFNNLKTKRDEIVQRNLAEGNLNTLGAHLLLILDNVNKLELIWQENLDILPDYFHVIITTREAPTEFPYIHSEPVDRLSEDESVELLSNLRPFGSDVAEITAARQIAQSLDGFTLVVELTGSYLARKPEVTYQQQYERMVVSHPETFQVMADRTRRLARHSAETVATVLESTLLALSDNARKALEFASLMAPDAVGFGWLPELLGLDENEGQKILDELTGYSLLTPLENEPNIARIHRLVADTVKKEIPEGVQKAIVILIREKCNELLHKDKTFWFISENSWNVTPISEFCMALAEQWTVEASEVEIDLNLTWLLDTSGDILRSLGKMNETRKVYQQCYEMREKRAKTFPESFSAQRDLSVSYVNLGDLENVAGNAAAAKEWYEKTLEVSKRLANLEPDNEKIQRDLCISYERLGDLEKAIGNVDAARMWFEKSLEIQKHLAELSDNVIAKRGLCISYERLGNMEKAAGNVDAARELYEKALVITQQLVEKMPDNVDAQRNLSILYDRLSDVEKAVGNVAAARELYEKSMEISKRLADLMPGYVDAQRNLSISYTNLGNLEYAAGNAVAAKEYYEKVLEIQQRLADLMPDNVDAQRGMGISYHKLGDLEKDAGNVAAAREWYEKALEIRKRLSDLMPDNVQVQQDLSYSYKILGDLEDAAGNAAAAQEWYEKALENRKRLAGQMLDDVEAQMDLSVSYNNHGDLEKDVGNVSAAREWYMKALEIDQRLTDRAPDNVKTLRNLSATYNKLGNLEYSLGNAAAAREWHEKALEIDQRLADLMPDDVKAQQDLSISYNNLGDEEDAAGNTDAAREWYEKALKIRIRLADLMPGDIETQRDLSFSYGRLGDLEKAAENDTTAREWYEKAMEINQRLVDLMPDDVDAQRGLGFSYHNLGDMEKADGNVAVARELYEKAIEVRKRLADLMPDNVDAQGDLGISYYLLGELDFRSGNFAAARELYEKAYEIFNQLAERTPDDVQVQKVKLSIQMLLTLLRNLT